jgi:hypothetical protein
VEGRLEVVRLGILRPTVSLSYLICRQKSRGWAVGLKGQEHGGLSTALSADAPSRRRDARRATRRVESGRVESSLGMAKHGRMRMGMCFPVDFCAIVNASRLGFARGLSALLVGIRSDRYDRTQDAGRLDTGQVSTRQGSR